MTWSQSVDEVLDEADSLIGAASPNALADAVDILQASLNIAPRDPRLTLRLAEAYLALPPNFDQGNEARAAAIAFAMRGVWLSPDDGGAHLVLAKALHQQHWYRLAIERLESSWKLEESAETAYWMAWLLSEVGELADDLLWLGRTRAMDAEHPGLAVEFGYAYRVLQRYDEAEPALLAAIEEDPSDDYTLANLVLLLVAQDRIDEVRLLVDRLSHTPASSAGPLNTTALASWLLGDRDAARPRLERMIQADRWETVGAWGTHAVDLLAEIHWHEGRREDARALIEWSVSQYGLRLHRASEGWGFRYDLARLAALQGDVEVALRWLRDAVDFGWNDSPLARRDPMFADLRQHTQLAVLLDDVDARVETMRQQVVATGASLT